MTFDAHVGPVDVGSGAFAWHAGEMVYGIAITELPPGRCLVSAQVDGPAIAPAPRGIGQSEADF